MSLRVLHIIPSIADCRGGPSKAIVEMVKALNAIDVHAEIATTNDACSGVLPVQLEQLIEYNNAPIRFFQRLSSSIVGLREFQYSKSFKQWLDGHISDYDIIHVHAIFSYCSSYAMWLARKNDIPYIVRPIGQLEHWSLKQKALKKKLYLALIEQNNLLSAQNIHFTAKSEQQQALENFAVRSSVVIPLGINMPEIIHDSSLQLRKKYGLSANDKIIMTMSRVHKKKGLELLLNALGKLNNTSFKLLIAGDGESEYRAELEALAARLDLKSQIKWLGFVKGEEKNLLLQGADLFTLTSYSENFGIAVLEALAAGTPALVSREVALSSEIERYSLGFVCEMNEQSICQNLEHALQQLDALNELGQLSRNFVNDHYQWSKIARLLDQTYQDSLG